jgi:hypothetical protein
MSSTLRSAIILVLAASAAPALAEQITCESHGSNAEACGTVQAGSSVRLQRQLSNSPCVEGRSWGADNDSIWVSGGCRAVFNVAPPNDRTARNQRDANGERDGDTANDRDDDGYRDEEDRHDDARRTTHYVSAEQAHTRARNACIDAAATERSIDPEEVRAADVRWLGQGLFAVRLDTPDGGLRCTVDREGNIRALDER